MGRDDVRQVPSQANPEASATIHPRALARPEGW